MDLLHVVFRWVRWVWGRVVDWLGEERGGIEPHEFLAIVAVLLFIVLVFERVT